MSNNNSTNDLINDKNHSLSNKSSYENNLFENKCDVPKYEYLENNDMCVIIFKRNVLLFYQYQTCDFWEAQRILTNRKIYFTQKNIIFYLYENVNRATYLSYKL